LTAKARRIDWVSVVLFYLVACAVSRPFFWWRDMHPKSWHTWRFPGALKTSCYMWGPGLAALVVFGLRPLRQPRAITFFGTSLRWSLAFYLIPLFALGIVYAPFAGIRAGVVGLLAVVGFFNILGEELGWRGFLQDALRPLPRGWRYLTIGILWEFWHFTNRFHGPDLGTIVRGLALSYPAVIALAVIIGEAADRSRSLVVAVTLHFWIDALFELPRLVDGPAWPTYLVFGLSILFWCAMLRMWPSAPPPSRPEFVNRLVPLHARD
jgi:membrane protease YdiL (CAAX protease family)